MHFHHDTETGTRLCADLIPHPEKEEHYLAIFRTQDPDHREQLVFVFTTVCGHPVLVQEYSTLIGDSPEDVQKLPLEAVIPKRVLTKELAGVREVAATTLAKVLDYVKPSMVIEPTEAFTQAMHKLEYIKSEEALEIKMLPPHIKAFLMSEVDEMIRMLQNAPNSQMANDLAEGYLQVLPSLEVPEKEEASEPPTPSFN